MKAVIDTNVIISSFISSAGLPRQLIKSGEEIRFDWLLSNGMYLELADVLFRPIIKEKYNIERNQVTMLLSFLATRCILVSPQTEASTLLQIHSNDKKDDKVLQCAIAGEADYLVTGDKKDLLLLNGQPQLGNTQIVSVRSFLSKLGS